MELPRCGVPQCSNVLGGISLSGQESLAVARWEAMGKVEEGLIWRTCSEGGLREQGQAMLAKIAVLSIQTLLWTHLGPGVTAGMLCPFCS